MKLIFENWKKYLKESGEEELIDIGDFESVNDMRKRIPTRQRSIGHGISQDPAYISRTKEIMSKTKDKWVIVTTNNVRDINDKVQSDDFQEWLDSKNYPKGSKIIVVGASPLEGDYTDPEWFLHDIIGHTVGDYFFKVDTKKDDIESPNQWLFDRPYGISMSSSESSVEQQNKRNEAYIKTKKETVAELLSILKHDVSPVPVDNKEDKIYDIFSSIVFGYLTLDEAIDAVGRGSVEKRMLVRKMFDACQKWIDSIEPDVPHVVEPWQV